MIFLGMCAGGPRRGPDEKEYPTRKGEMKMRRELIFGTLFAVMLLATVGTVFADPVDYDKKSGLGIYYLVTKDASWNPVARSISAFGMGKFSIVGGTLTMHIVAHKLTPGYWYFVELVDKSTGWNPLNPQNQQANVLVQFYGQADAYGDVVITFSWTISGQVEVDMKNADWVPLFDGATLGDPSEWIHTGQGWGYVLYGMTLLTP